MLVFPAPEGPTIAVIWFCGILTEISSRIFLPEYENSTLSKEISKVVGFMSFPSISICGNSSNFLVCSIDPLTTLREVVALPANFI